jgi:hypothetical protein
VAFPSVVARATHVSATTNSITYSTASATLNGSVGDLLIAVISADGNPTLTAASNAPFGADWTKLGQASNGTIATGAVFWKFANTATWGTNADLLNISASASEQFSAVLLRLSGTNLALAGASANGSSTNSDPPNLALPGGAAKDALWIATRSGDSTVVATAAPASFANLQSRAAGGTGGASTNTAERLLNASALDPGTFTSASEQWVSWTLAVHEGSAVPLYRGAAGKAATYKGIRSDAALYKGAGQLWP